MRGRGTDSTFRNSAIRASGLSSNYGPFMRCLAPSRQHKPVQFHRKQTSATNRGVRHKPATIAPCAGDVGHSVKNGSPLRVAKQSPLVSDPSVLHAEGLPNTSAVFSISSLADRDDVLAVVRTAILLAGCSGTSLNVTILDETLLELTHEHSSPKRAAERLLSRIKTRLGPQFPHGPDAQFAIEASITAASFLKTSSVSLHVRAVDALSQNPSTKR